MQVSRLGLLILHLGLICGPLVTIKANSIRDDFLNPLEIINMQHEWHEESAGDGEYSKPVPEMIRDQGYGCEIHNYTTEDGYINTLHRILPQGNSNNNKVVFLQHGLLGSSANFVVGSTHNSLGFFLAHLGYDVWLGNARGNEYSRGHITLTTNDPEYWKFSFDQMGQFDLPAAFYKVRAETGVDTLAYVGHSMGTTMFWVALNENPDLKDRIEVMIALGPVAKVKHVVGPLQYLAHVTKIIEPLVDVLGINEVSPSNPRSQAFMRMFCDQNERQKKFCEDITFFGAGFDMANANMTLLPYIWGHTPGGSSIRPILHYGQLIQSGKFCKYDYGSAKKNMKVYNATVPPNYDLSKVEVPVELIWGDNDWLADPKDVVYLINNLPNLVMNYEVPYKKFNHIDYLWALNANKLVFPKVEAALDKQMRK